MPDPYSSVSYRRTFLKQVIARADFVGTLPIATALPKEVSAAALQIFPIAEPRDLSKAEIQISDKATLTQSKIKQWIFHGRNREKSFSILPDAVNVEYTAYSNYEQLRADYTTVMAAIIDKCPSAQISRLGLRYINVIDQNGNANPTDWSGELAPSIVDTFRFPEGEDRATVARMFHVLDFAFPDCNLRFQFGMTNPDYPAAIRQKVFTLDLDAYIQGLIDPADISVTLDRLHARVQAKFEESITGALRALMNG